MWHKAKWKGHPMRRELTRVGLLVQLANHYTTRGAWLYLEWKKLLNYFLLQDFPWTFFAAVDIVQIFLTKSLVVFVVARQKFPSRLPSPFYCGVDTKNIFFFLFVCSHFFLLKFNFSLMLCCKFKTSSSLLRRGKVGHLLTPERSKRYLMIANKEGSQILGNSIFIR